MLRVTRMASRQVLVDKARRASRTSGCTGQLLHNLRWLRTSCEPRGRWASWKMRTARSIEAQLRQAATHLPEAGPPLRRYGQVRHWTIYAKEYLAASVVLRALEAPLLHPWAQVSGHAVECALKSFLCAVGTSVPQNHDLIGLLDLARPLGLTVEDRDIFLLADINHLYFTDLVSRTRHKARYPTDRSELFGGTIPDSEFLTRVVHDFCNQASAVNERLNRTTEAAE